MTDADWKLKLTSLFLLFLFVFYLVITVTTWSMQVWYVPSCLCPSVRHILLCVRMADFICLQVSPLCCCFHTTGSPSMAASCTFWGMKLSNFINIWLYLGTVIFIPSASDPWVIFKVYFSSWLPLQAQYLNKYSIIQSHAEIIVIRNHKQSLKYIAVLTGYQHILHWHLLLLLFVICYFYTPGNINPGGIDPCG